MSGAYLLLESSYYKSMLQETSQVDTTYHRLDRQSMLQGPAHKGGNILFKTAVCSHECQSKLGAQSWKPFCMQQRVSSGNGHNVKQ